MKLLIFSSGSDVENEMDVVVPHDQPESQNPSFDSDSDNGSDTLEDNNQVLN